MLFEEVYSVWTKRRLTQEEAGRLLGICPRTFRRWAGGTRITGSTVCGTSGCRGRRTGRHRWTGTGRGTRDGT